MRKKMTITNGHLNLLGRHMIRLECPRSREERTGRAMRHADEMILVFFVNNCVVQE